MKITHYLAGFILGANLVIVGNGGRVSAGRERQACLSRLSRVDGRSTQTFVYSAAISPHRKLLQVVIGCNSLIGSFSDTFLGLKFQCPTTSFFIPASTCHNLTFPFLLPHLTTSLLSFTFLLPLATGLLFGDT